MTDKDLIKKLAKRIHNQRVALRQEGMFSDARINARVSHNRPIFYAICVRQGKELVRLRAIVKIQSQPFYK